jgi:predicted CoA-binding protein
MDEMSGMGERTRGRKLTEDEDLAAIVRSMRTIAVVGMKGEDRPQETAYRIPAMLRERGYRVLAVNPMLQEVWGEPAYVDVAGLPSAVDVLDVFRRPEAIPALTEQILALPAARRPKTVWLQSGIAHDASAERLIAAGIDVVQDRCLGVYASRYASRPGASG